MAGEEGGKSPTFDHNSHPFGSSFQRGLEISAATPTSMNSFVHRNSCRQIETISQINYTK